MYRVLLHQAVARRAVHTIAGGATEAGTQAYFAKIRVRRARSPLRAAVVTRLTVR